MADDDARSKAALELLKNDLQHQETLSQALSGLIQASLRVSFLVNGAAIVAALSVYGAKGLDSAFPKKALGVAILAWVVGLLASAGAAAFYTWAQRQFQVAAGEQSRNRANEHFGIGLRGERTGALATGECLRLLAIVLWWLSLFAFCAGAIIIIWRAFLV